MKNIYKLIMAALAVTAFGAGALAFAASQDPSIATGQALWGELRARQIQCGQLTDANFNNLGDYFMDQMMGSAHEAMEQAVIARSGQTGLDQMHIAMGKRFSGCDPNAAYPAGMMNYGMMPMTGGYGNYDKGSWPAPYQNNSMFNMMGYGYGPGSGYMGTGGWILMVLFWILVVFGIVALLRWGMHGGGHHRGEKSVFEILKERYAKGEIDRKEFEERKKDLE